MPKTPKIQDNLDKQLLEAMLNYELNNTRPKNPSDCQVRLEANRNILVRLEEFIEKNPDLRFIQALWAVGIIERDQDKFYEESVDTERKLDKTLLTSKS